MLLARFLPDFDVREQHSIAVDRAPDAVLAEARLLSARDAPLFLVLMALRSLPALRRRRRLSPGGRPLVDEFLRAGFVLLAERHDEIVLGAVGRFWRPTGDVRPLRPEEFAGFAEPGWAKAAVNFHVAEADGRTLLSTETRVLATDERTRRRFRRYWLLVHPGSAAIRRAWLRAIRRRAERRPGGPASGVRRQ
jgi:hypothetical protein